MIKHMEAKYYGMSISRIPLDKILWSTLLIFYYNWVQSLWLTGRQTDKSLTQYTGGIVFPFDNICYFLLTLLAVGKLTSYWMRSNLLANKKTLTYLVSILATSTNRSLAYVSATWEYDHSGSILDPRGTIHKNKFVLWSAFHLQRPEQLWGTTWALWTCWNCQ